MSLQFMFTSDHIKNIMPLQNSKIPLLCKEKMYDFDTMKDNLSN